MKVLDPVFLLENLDGDRELLAHIVATFRSSFPQMLDGIRQATASADANLVHQTAHRMKGALAVLGAEAASAAAAELESLGRRGEIGTADQALATLEGELNRLDPELDALLTSGA